MSEICVQQFMDESADEGYEMNVNSIDEAGIWDQLVAIVLGLADPVELT